jgi:hypothetical protein
MAAPDRIPPRDPEPDFGHDVLAAHRAAHRG